MEKKVYKIWAYTIVEHLVVVHLDVDTVVLKPLDDLFDSMLPGLSLQLSEEETEQKLNCIANTRFLYIRGFAWAD